MNSASTVDMAMRLCFRDYHEIAPLLAKNTWPPWDLRSTLSLAQSESKYPTRLLLMTMSVAMAMAMVMPMAMLMLIPLPVKCSQTSAVD